MSPTDGLVGPTRLRHNRVDLALWTLRGGQGRPLLVLHGLGGRTTTHGLERFAGWPGPVHGLDFTGHGASSIPAGGGYYCEVLMGDVDIALEHLGERMTVVGHGLGGYVAMMIAGARPTGVRGAVIADGPGLNGGGAIPPDPIFFRPPAGSSTPDPVALVDLAQDVRPPDYAQSFAWQAANLSGLDTPILVSAVPRPAWLEAILSQPGVAEAELDDALAHFAAVESTH